MRRDVDLRAVEVPARLLAAGCRAWAVVEDTVTTICLDATMAPCDAAAAALRLAGVALVS